MLANFSDAIVLGSIYTLFALGLTLSWGVLGVLNLAHGAIFALGAVTAYRISNISDLGIQFVLPLAMIVGGAVAVAAEILVFRVIRGRSRDAELATMIASIGVTGIVTGVCIKLTAGDTQTIARATFSVHPLGWGDLGLTNIDVVIVAVSVVLSFGTALFVGRTQTGRALRAIAADRYTCGLMGIAANRLAVLTMFVAGAFAGAAGVLLALRTNSVSAYMGDALMLKAFAILVIGSVGSAWGAIAGAYLLALVEVVTIAYVASDLADAATFILILAVLVVRPQGLLGRSAWQRA